MKANKSAIAFACLFLGLSFYPAGVYFSKMLSREPAPTNFSPWPTGRELITPLPVLIPGLLVIMGCIISVRLILQGFRAGGIKATLGWKTIHLWLGLLLLIYIIVSYGIVILL